MNNVGSDVQRGWGLAGSVADLLGQLDVADLVLQGGALAVVLCCFIFVLMWLLGNFTKALARIEKGQFAITQALLGISKLQMHANFNLNGFSIDDKESKAVSMYHDIRKTIDQIDATITQLALELERQK